MKGALGIPNFLQNAKVYVDGANIGVADVELPDLAYMTEKVKALGIAGEIEEPVVGHFKELKLKLKFATATKEFGKLLRPEMKIVEVYASLQEYDRSLNKYRAVPYKATFNAKPLSMKSGKVDVGKAMDSEFEMTATTYKLEIDGYIICDIDIPNAIALIDGEDYLAEVRANLGM